MRTNYQIGLGYQHLQQGYLRYHQPSKSLQELNINLVLLDVMMPGKSGIEVLSEIRTHSNRSIREIPVMMITAKSSTEDIDAALAAGANSYVIKPFRATTIREKVRSILELPAHA